MTTYDVTETDEMDDTEPGDDAPETEPGYEIDESMDGDHESALESVYGPLDSPYETDDV